MSFVDILVVLIKLNATILKDSIFQLPLTISYDISVYLVQLWPLTWLHSLIKNIPDNLKYQKAHLGTSGTLPIDHFSAAPALGPDVGIDAVKPWIVSCVTIDIE
jgi:hypothetical protein